MARILFTCFGSFGDLYPYIAIGVELQRRGHHVTIGTSPSFRPNVESENIEFAAIRPDVSLGDRELLQHLFDEKRGSERVVRLVSSVVRESYDDTLKAAKNTDLIVTHPITFGAVLVAQKLQMPWVSSVLAPISFVSAHDPPVLPPALWLTRLRVFGPGLMKRIFDLGRWQSLRWVRPVTDLRSELKLPSRGNPLFEGSQSPSLVLALFSSLIGEPQPDWPSQTVVTGFPFYDGPGADSQLAPELQRFFDAGPRPIVFTLGSSAVGAAGNFYMESLGAVQNLNVRAVFLTGAYPQGLPATLPNNAIAWPYAPHSEVFPRAAAIVHQGGVGTTAQAMRSGRPMLVVPFAHDQYDNGERVRLLGAGDVLYRSRYHAPRVSSVLRRLLADSSFQDAAVVVSQRIRAENGSAAAANAIEAQLRSASRERGGRHIGQ